MVVLLMVKVQPTWTKQSGGWVCSTSHVKNMSAQDTLSCHQALERAERLWIERSPHSLQELTDDPGKHGLLCVEQIGPDAIGEQPLSIPIELLGAPGPVLAKCRYTTSYSDGSWVCKVTGLPFMGVGSAPLEAHQNVENALKAYVLHVYEKKGWKGVLKEKGNCLTINETSEEELRKTAILFPCAVAQAIRESPPLELPKELEVRLTALGNLPANWDSYASSSVSQVTLEKARRLLLHLSSLSLTSMPSPFIAPDPEGGLGLEWDFGLDREIFLSISSKGELTYVLSMGEVHAEQVGALTDDIRGIEEIFNSVRR